MSKFLDLQEDPTVSQWLDIVRKKPRTVRNYLMGLQKYVEFTGLSPDELLTEAEEEAAKQIIMRKRKILTRLLGFRKHLEVNFAPNSVRNYLNCVNSFYKAFYVEVPRLMGSKDVEPMPENVKQITKDDIRDVLKIADPLEKAIVLVGASSGLSAAEIMNLKVIDFKGGYDPETGITTLKLTRIKTGINFCTFLSPEASNAVLDYLKFRERGIKKGPHPSRQSVALAKQKIVSDGGHLFIMQSVSDKYLSSKDEELRKFNDDSFNQ